MMWRSSRCIDPLVLALVAAAMTMAAAPFGEPHAHSGHPAPQQRYHRTIGTYSVPAVHLVDSAGRSIALPALLARDEPVVLQFIFTTCPTVCPVLTGTLASAHRRMQESTQADRARLISITIDPEVDTPQRLAEYRQFYGAPPAEGGDMDWLFLTGRLDDIVAVQRAFDTYRGNKMRHEPVTLLRSSPDVPWTRLEGFPSARQLAEEIHQILN